MATGCTGEMGKVVTHVLFGNGVEMQILAASIAALVLWQAKRKISSGPNLGRKVPPGPPNLPLVGVMFSMEPNIDEWYRKMAKKYGKIFYYRLGSHGIIVVSSAKGAEEVLKTKDAIFANRPDNGFIRSAAKYLGFDASDTMFQSLTENQKNLKKLLISNFFTASKLTRFESIRRREGAYMVEDIQRQISDSGSTVQVSVTLLDTLINLITSLILGKRYADASEGDPLKHCPEIIRWATSLFLKMNLGDLLPWLAWADIQGLDKEFKQFKQLCDEVFGQIIEEHRAVRTTNKDYKDRDFVDLLLTLYEEGKITEKAIPGSIDDMLVGGTDVTAVITEWALLELTKNPDCLARLQQEIDDVVGKDRRVEESDFPKMPYFQAVVQESFRLHAPAPNLVPHFTPQATTLQGFYVPANTTVFVNLRAITRDPLYWKNPEKFAPDRFMNREQVNLTEGIDFSVFPFGSGRRRCPAATMGHLLFQRYLATLVHAFDWSPPPGKNACDIDTTPSVGVLSRPATPLVLSAKPRLAPGIYIP